jgi:site-specific DNA-methyltransferase (adenine-specific)
VRFEILNTDCLAALRGLVSESVDLTVTSPPYDDLRAYNGYSFDFEGIAEQLARVTKPGGVVVWVVADATVAGSETGTSFRQALHFKDACGFNLHDTMIWNKGGFSAVGALQTRYAPVFEYMFVFTKGKPKTFNPIKDRANKHAGGTVHGTVRDRAGKTKAVSGGNAKIIADFGQRFNVWEIPPHRQQGEGRHPAPFPESIARDHILSWSNPGDTVLDPFLGSGTTGAVALAHERKFIGMEISHEYFAIAKERIEYADAADLL